MAQDNVQLKREEVVGNDVVLQDINPKTKTNSIEDSTKGVPLDQTLALIKNMINNKLARVVNSVNGRTGVVILDANDVGLGNVDNVSFGDIKRWVIEYLGDIFETKRIIIREWLTDIQTITGSNDKAYANCAFYTEKGSQTENDYMAYIGFIWWDEEHSRLQETHRPIRVVGYTDKSLIYNVDMTNYGRGDFRHGGLGVNIWSGEDALKIMSNYIGHNDYDPADLARSGLYIDKTKIVPNVYFFDGAYGPLSENPLRAVNGLVYWSSDPNDTTVGDLDLITINVNGNPISLTASSGRTPNMLHTPQEFKEGDIIICNFAYDDYINWSDTREHSLYEGMVDSLTCRQPAIGRVTRVGHGDTPYIVDFYQLKPNIGHGLKLITTNGDIGINDVGTMIGIDEMNNVPKMGDGTNIGIQPVTSNISGINILDKNGIGQRTGETTTSNTLYTVYPSGKSTNLLTDGEIQNDSTFITPNFSLCVIPSYDMLTNGDSVLRPMSNWNPKAPNSSVLTNTSWGHRMNILGVNLEKTIFGTSLTDEPHRYARNISGLRVNSDDDVLHESWFGFGDDTSTELYEMHSGGLSVNVGDFLGIGTAEELAAETHTTMTDYYNEGKVNVRINKMEGLHNAGNNSLGINLAQGVVYGPNNYKDGGLKFIDNQWNHGVLGVNTGQGGRGLDILSPTVVGVTFTNYGLNKEDIFDTNVLAVKPFMMNHAVESGWVTTNVSGMEIHNIVKEEDIAHLIPIKNLWEYEVWKTQPYLEGQILLHPGHFDTEHIYVAGGERYLWTGNGEKTVHYFMFYTDAEEFNEVITAMNNGTNIEAEGQTISYEILRRQCHVLITPNPTNSSIYDVQAYIYMVGSSQPRIPDLNHDGDVNLTDSDIAKHIYECSTSTMYIYSDQSRTHFYTDSAMTEELEPLPGHYYEDQNDELIDDENLDHRYHKLYETYSVGSGYYIRPIRWDNAEIALADYMNADVDRDGRINLVDVNAIYNFNTRKETGYFPLDTTLQEKWIQFLREEYGINVGNGRDSAVKVLDYKYSKGVRVRYNELKGLTTDPVYVGRDTGRVSEYIDSDDIATNDVLNSLGIKIADPSSGVMTFDQTIYGGLRFAAKGHLAIRINNKQDFISVFPNHNTKYNYDDLTVGSKGLHIYNNNVLGIQLTKDGDGDNGELYFDENGCLRISNPSGGSREKLIIDGEYADGAAATVPYDGTERVEITLGPGLCWATPPDPPVVENPSET